MSTLYMYYIIDCIQGNSKVGDYIIPICNRASMYVCSIALVHSPLMAITINLDYLSPSYYIKYYIISIGWGKVIEFVIKAIKLLGFKAKWFIGFKAFMGHI